MLPPDGIPVFVSVDHTGRVKRSIDEMLDVIFRDLAAAGIPLPRVDPTPWQSWEPSESVMIFAPDGSGMGVWLDLTLTQQPALAQLADQVQEWVVEELPGLGRPTNWPVCPAHPANHPRQAVVEEGRAVWVCPAGGDGSTPIGGLASE